MRTVSRMYDNYADAVAVVTDLEAATDLTPNRQISMIANENAHGRVTTVDTTRTETTSEAGPGAGHRCDSRRWRRTADRPRIDGHPWCRVHWSPPAGWQRPWQAQRLARRQVASSARSSSPASLMKRPKCMKRGCAEAARWSACRPTRRMCRRSKRFLIAG